jgi:isopenicillin N synthase-like dioxygenase
MPAFTIPRLDVSALFTGDRTMQRTMDAAVYDAATSVGFLVIEGLAALANLTIERREFLLGVFALPEKEIRKLWLCNFDHSQKNSYRGRFPLQNGFPTHKEGIDIGPDIVHGNASVEADDPLLSATPLPAENVLPGWRAAARDYYVAMAKTSATLMRCIARGLAIDENGCAEAFEGGISTLRLIHYPVRPERSFAGAIGEHLWTEYHGERRYLTGRAHADSGFLTLLA